MHKLMDMQGFHTCRIVTNAAMNAGMKTSCNPDFKTFAQISQWNIAVLYGSSIFNWKNTIYQS